MFIENLRHVKNKRRLLVAILMGLIMISLVATFAYVGTDYGVSANTSADYLASAEEGAKSAESAAKADASDVDAQESAVYAYLSLAAYQELYLEDNAKSYEKALKYAQAMVAAYADADEPNYEAAYSYEISAYRGLADADGMSDAFNESLGAFDLTQSYLDTYYSAMSTLGANDQFVADMETVASMLKDQLEEGETAGSEEEATEDEDSEASEETGAVTASDLLDYVATLVGEATGTTDTTEE
jgi:hypothetical protein